MISICEKIVRVARDYPTITREIDYNDCLGSTVLEKYEFLYVNFFELTKELLDRGNKGYFWMAANRKICNIFEVATAGFAPNKNPFPHVVHSNEDYVPLGYDDIIDLGILHKKWKVFCVKDLQEDCILIGCVDTKNSVKNSRLNSCAKLILKGSDL